MLTQEPLNSLPLFKAIGAMEAPAPKHWSVTELTSNIRKVLEPAFTQVWVQGEVSNYRPAGSGHAYFSLKDQGASIAAAYFGWGARKRGFDLKDGIQVLCRGKISVYPPRGNYQLIVDQLEPLGAGALQIAFEKLKAQLASEGLFNSAVKRPLPRFPTRIAVVTSPSGAAIQDMLNILKRRAAHLRVTVIPALVQGDEAPAQIIRGLEWANRYQLGEIIVLARGGGSIEDLWCFNHEQLAREIRKSKIPVISAIGHEIDFTIADFVADLRAPTPSAAAEIVTEGWVGVSNQIRDLAFRMKGFMLRDLANRKNILKHIAARVVNPRDRLREQIQKTDELSLRLERAFKNRLEKKRALLNQLVCQLDALSPLRVLERGYSLVQDPSAKGAVVKSVEQIRVGQELQIKFCDGEVPIRVL